jgi:hypothetical protein
MPGRKPALECLKHIPTTEVLRAWNERRARRDLTWKWIKRWAAHPGSVDYEFSSDELALLRATGEDPLLLLEIPKALGPHRARQLVTRLYRLYFDAVDALQDRVWRETFAEFARAVERDLNKKIRALRNNPKLRYRDWAEADLRRLVYERDVLPHLPPEFIAEWGQQGPPDPETVARVSARRDEHVLTRYFEHVFQAFRAVGTREDLARQWALRILIWQGIFDPLTKSEEQQPT